MDTDQSLMNNAHEFKHMESVGQVDYQRMGGHNTSGDRISGSMPDHYKHSREYADVSLEAFRPASQHDQGHEMNQYHEEQQRLSSEEDQVDESSDCQVSVSSKGGVVEENANMVMQPLYSGHLMMPENNPRGNNSDLDSITRSHNQLKNLPEQQHSQQHQGWHQDSESSGHHQHQQYNKAQMIAIQQQSQTQMEAPTQHSFEGYQTDITNTSHQPPAAYNNNATVKQESQQMAPLSPQQPKSVIEYTEVFVWGEDRQGQLGIDSQLQLGANNQQVERPEFVMMPRSCSFNIVIKEVSCGQSHSAILTEHGHLYMMGSNLHGQLGVNTVGPPPELERQLQDLTTAQVESLYCAGSPILVEELKGVCVEQVSCGQFFTTAVCRRRVIQEVDSVHHGVKSEVFAWGSNEFGQLGDGQMLKTNVPMRVDAFDVLEEEITMVSCGGSHTLYVTSDHDVISCGNNTNGQCGFDPEECAQTSTPFKVAAFDGVSIQQLSAGQDHSLFLSQDGKVYASGSNRDLQLGIGDSFDHTQTPTLIQAIKQHTMVRVEASFNSAAIDSQGHLFMWGQGIWGESPFPQSILTISNPVIDVSLGRDVGIAVDEQGIAWCWGANSHGELGVGDLQPRVHPFPILNMKGKVIKKAQCGDAFSVCLGNNVSKEIPSQKPTMQSEMQPIHEQKKKRTGKKKKVGDPSRRKLQRPSTSGMTNGGHSSFPLLSKKMPKQHVDVRNATFGNAGNSRSNSFERGGSLSAVASQGGVQLRRHSRNGSTKRTSKERAIVFPLQQKCGTGASSNAKQTMVVTMSSHDKSRMYNDQLPNSRSSGDTSPMNMSRPPLQDDYESGQQSDVVSRTMKQLKKQMKGIKDENRALKQELQSKIATIEKLEKTVQKLQHSELYEKQVQELTADLKRTEMKLRKMKERRNHYRSEKDTASANASAMLHDNEQLNEQFASLQEKSHQMREENSKLMAKLKHAERQLEKVNSELRIVEEQADQIKGQNDEVEKEFQGQIRWQESKIGDLEGQVRFESDQRDKMAQEIARLEKLVSSREDYVCSLENEAVFLRKEIKNAKFNNEKQGYTGFLTGLTQLRKSGDRSRSNNRATTLDQQTSSQPDLHHGNNIDSGYDDLPSRDAAHRRKSPAQPPKQLFSASKDGSLDARSRLMMKQTQPQLSQQKPQVQPQQTESNHQSYAQLRRTVVSPTRQTDKQQPYVIQPSQKMQPQHEYQQYPSQQPRKPDVSNYQTVSSHLSEQIESKAHKARLDSYQSQQQDLVSSYHVQPESHTIGSDSMQIERNQQDTIQAIVPLDSIKVHEEEPLLSSGRQENIAIVSRMGDTIPVYEEKENNHILFNRPNEELADNSMVIQAQHSELVCKDWAASQKNSAPDALISSSSFTDQSRKLPTPSSIINTDKSQAGRKVSTMIPLGAPKGDEDLRDRYKQMLMAKLDAKTIQRRKRKESSQEP